MTYSDAQSRAQTGDRGESREELLQENVRLRRALLNIAAGTGYHGSDQSKLIEWMQQTATAAIS